MAGARTRLALLAFGASLACGWWVTGLEPFSGHANWAVLTAGLVAMAAGRAAPAESTRSGPPLRAAVPWAVLVGALMAWELTAYVQHPRSEHPTLSSLTNSVLDPKPVRALAFAAWMLIAGWIARR